MGRFVVTDNIVELSRVLTLPIGFEFIGSSNDRFDALVLRKNNVWQIPDINHLLRTDASGISVTRATHLIVENNIISDTTPENAVRFENCGTRKFFNNQNKAGELLRGYDGTKFAQELEDAVQDVLLPI